MNIGGSEGQVCRCMYRCVRAAGVQRKTSTGMHILVLGGRVYLPVCLVYV